MRQRYRKKGNSVRVELHEGRRTVVIASEEGVATSDGVHFVASTRRLERAPAETGSGAAERLADRLAALVLPPLHLERLAVIAGTAEHEVDAPHARSWNDETVRVHFAVIHPVRKLRLLFDLGAAGTAPIETTALEEALARFVTEERPLAPASLVLDPPVASALWPDLLEALVESRTESIAPLRIGQRVSSPLRLDGDGEPVREAVLFEQRPLLRQQWPNIYRPSYRFRPTRAAIDVCGSMPVEPAATPSVRAFALLAPPRVAGGKFSLSLLCGREGGGGSFPLQLVETPGAVVAMIASVGSPEGWYPYGAGSFGSRVVLERIGPSAVRPLSG